MLGATIAAPVSAAFFFTVSPVVDIVMFMFAFCVLFVCFLVVTMFTGATKIVKPEGQEADEFEQTVAQELFNLEVSPNALHSRHCIAFCLYRARTPLSGIALMPSFLVHCS